MANIARKIGGQMVRRFAERVPFRIRTVVAGSALTGDDTLRGRMRELRGGEAAARGVTTIAR